MRIYGMLLVKDEADIIRATLTDMFRWVDMLFVIDNGSTDGTWQILQELSGDKLVPWKQDFAPFRRSMRAGIFRRFRDVSEEGDWWYFADSDEFCVDDPREFLDRVPSRDHVVFKKSIDYFLTEEDVRDHEFTGDFSVDRNHIRYIEPNCWTEMRFFRYRRKLKWELNREMPDHIGLRYPEPIIVQHFQFRSPAQMQKRLDIRNRIPRDKEGKPFKHVKEKDWEELLRRKEDLVPDEGYEQYRKLPMRRSLKESLPRHVIKRLLHGLMILP